MKPGSPKRGLLDLLAASLCLWAAAYHTPVGAFARQAAGWATGVRVSSRSVLAYYGGGVLAAEDAPVVARWVGAELPPEEAMALGLQLTLAQQRPAVAAALAQANGTSLEQLTRPRALAPLSSLLRNQERALGSKEAAVLSFFIEEVLVRHAAAQAGGKGLEALAARLPPQMASQLGLAHRALGLGTAYGLGWPVPESTRVTSPFGYRLHPVLGTRKMHNGVDLAVPSGTEVRASFAGRVVRASEDAVNGLVLVVEHPNGVTSAYCHNSRLLVHQGQRVAKGDKLALSGNTGRSTGPHLHYQVELSGVPMNPVAFRPLRQDAVAGGAAL